MKITESSLRQIIRTILLSELNDTNAAIIKRAVGQQEKENNKEEENKQKVKINRKKKR